jgi:hypothetical protein
MKRFIYLIYYIKQLDFHKFNKFIAFATTANDTSKTTILFDAFRSVFKYNIGLMDYFYFKFYEKEDTERLKWAGTGYMYEYHLLMNPKKSRQILENKIEFLDSYSSFVKRSFAGIETLKNNPDINDKLLSNSTGKIVLKLSNGQVGKEVKVYETKSFSKESLIEEMRSKNFDLAEEYVIQHPALMALSPTGLNTVRIFTQLEGEKVIFLGARLRISVNSQVDNLGAGNIAAPLDISTGTVNGPGIYSDITKEDETIHPITNQPIIGFQVPFWNETIMMIEKAAILHPENKSIGWDIAITANGPELIEGNHNWCKLLWQLPVKQGLKPMIEKYMI